MGRIPLRKGWEYVNGRIDSIYSKENHKQTISLLVNNIGDKLRIKPDKYIVANISNLSNIKSDAPVTEIELYLKALLSEDSKDKLQKTIPGKISYYNGYRVYEVDKEKLCKITNHFFRDLDPITQNQILTPVIEGDIK